MKNKIKNINFFIKEANNKLEKSFALPPAKRTIIIIGILKP